MKPHVRGVPHLFSAGFYLLPVWRILHQCPSFILFPNGSEGLGQSWRKLLVPGTFLFIAVSLASRTGHDM